MATRESPVFVGTPKGNAVNCAASTSQTVTLFAADSTNGSAINAINLYEHGSSSATVKLILNDGTSNFYIANFTLAGVAGTATNLLKSSVLPFIDDNNPILTLKGGWSLRLEVPSVSNQLHVYTQGGDFTA